ncbi:MAG: hypothetical protein ACOYOA_00830 [Saprospiraceae bacterium]
MKKQAGHRLYNVPDADLYLQCLEVIKNILRDIELFRPYGYDVERLKGFRALCDRIHALPDDDEMVGDQMIVTEKKTKSAEKLKNAIRSVMTRVEIKFNNRSGRYRKFGTSKIGDMTDAQLLFCGRRVIRVARQQIDFLSDTGLNDLVISKVQEACTEFENAMNIQQDKIADRDIAVERRVEIGNQLYTAMILACNIGKDIWAEKDMVKYQQYVIYESNNEQKKARKVKISTID